MSFPEWLEENYEEVIENVKKVTEALNVLDEYGFEFIQEYLGSDEPYIRLTYDPHDRDVQSPAVTYEPGIGWGYTIEG